MATIEAGTNWAVKRNFIPQSLLAEAGREALFLCNLARNGRMTTLEEGSSKRRNGASTVTITPSKLTARSHPSRLLPVSSALLEIYQWTEEEVANGLDRFRVDSYGAGGTTGAHMDQEAKAAFMVGLTGQTEATIQDPETGEHRTTLHPGDAIYFAAGDASTPDVPMYVVRNSLIGPARTLHNG